MKKILTVVGARPQFVKAAVVSRALAMDGRCQEKIVHTGQHFDPGMSDVFFEELEIPRPAHDLKINGGGHGNMTGRMMIALEDVVLLEKPDCILIYGDTNSTVAGALVGAKLQIPVAHVEAGLRSFNRLMPEEINRVVADHVSSLLLCPTAAAVANLRQEGVVAGVHAVGDVMFDATLFAIGKSRTTSHILRDFDLSAGGYDIATIHRAESTSDPARLSAIVAWLNERARHRALVLPLHPRTRLALVRTGLAFKGVRIIDPVGYLDMTRLLADCVEVYTDSGGLQKEAYFHRKPCTTLRDETEWVETIEAGWNRLWRQERRNPYAEIPDYGSGDAAQRIAAIMCDMLSR
jgi:UDP-GlcNAc3NAcA epimerase